MINPDLKRVQDDLATVKSALGWDLPFNGQSVLGSLAIGAGGLLCMIWMMQPYRLAGPWDFAAATALIWLPPLLWLAYTAVNGVDLGHRRWDFQKAQYRTAISIPFILAFFVWGIKTDLVSANFGASALIFIVGATLLAVITGDRNQTFQVGWAIGIMLFAILRLVSGAHFLVLFGMQIAIGGLVGAAVMAWQLRGVERLQRAH